MLNVTHQQKKHLPHATVSTSSHTVHHFTQPTALDVPEALATRYAHAIAHMSIYPSTNRVDNAHGVADESENAPAPTAPLLPIQLQAQEEQTEPIIRPFGQTRRARKLPMQKLTVPTRNNASGLPPNLKIGIENLSGQSMDDVQVHYRSSEPARLGALAFTQGTEIHLGPRQERYLPHEAWHVAQQKQGRVKRTVQARGVAINADQGLEQEATTMGMKALHSASHPQSARHQAAPSTQLNSSAPPIQMMDDPELGMISLQLGLLRADLDRATSASEKERLTGEIEHLLAARKKIAEKRMRRRALKDDDKDKGKEVEESETQPEPKKERKKKLAKSEEEEPETGGSMISAGRIQAYYQQVRNIEQAMQKNKKLTGAQILKALYDASKLLLPTMAKEGVFPSLKLVKEGTDGALSPQEWQMEVPEQTSEEIAAAGLKKLSATFFHETRHAEQIWMEVQIRKQKSQKLKQISKEMPLPIKVVGPLYRLELSKGADTSHMGTIVGATQEQRKGFKKIRDEVRTLSLQSETLQWGELVQDTTSTAKLERLKKLLKEDYPAIPDEADAFAAQALYEKYYAEQDET